MTTAQAPAPSPTVPRRASRSWIAGTGARALDIARFPLALPLAPKNRAGMHPLQRCLAAEDDVRLRTLGIDPAFESVAFRVHIYAAYGVFGWTEDAAEYVYERAGMLIDSGVDGARAEAIAMCQARARAFQPAHCATCRAFKMLRDGRGTCAHFERLVQSTAHCPEYRSLVVDDEIHG